MDTASIPRMQKMAVGFSCWLQKRCLSTAISPLGLRFEASSTTGHSTKLLLRPTSKVVVACRPSFLPTRVCSILGIGYHLLTDDRSTCGCICSCHAPRWCGADGTTDVWDADGLRLAQRLSQKHDRPIRLGVGQGYQIPKAILRQRTHTLVSLV